MNTDDFERDLERQPMRGLPPEWREAILNAARADTKAQGAGSIRRSGATADAAVRPASWWRELLWPCPQAWFGLAAVWMVILGLRFMAGVEPRFAAESSLVNASPEWRALMAEQRQLYAELLGRAEPPPSHPRVEPADRPRTERSDPHRFSTGLTLGPPAADAIA